MGKDRALGNDPLGWMKAANENKKPSSVEKDNGTNQNVVKNDQQANPRIANQQIPPPLKSGRDSDSPGEPQPSGKAAGVPDNTSAPRQKVVIGRLYEKLPVEKLKTSDQGEGLSPESKSYTMPSGPESKPTQSMKRMESLISRQTSPVPAVATTTTADRISPYVMIAYTALFLILGYLVYSDLSKRIRGVEARILAIEKVLLLRK